MIFIHFAITLNSIVLTFYCFKETKIFLLLLHYKFPAVFSIMDFQLNRNKSQQLYLLYNSQNIQLWLKEQELWTDKG